MMSPVMLQARIFPLELTGAAPFFAEIDLRVTSVVFMTSVSPKVALTMLAREGG